MKRLEQMATEQGKRMMVEAYKTRSAILFYALTTEGEQREFAQELVRENAYSRMAEMLTDALRQGVDASRDYAECCKYLGINKLG